MKVKTGGRMTVAIDQDLIQDVLDQHQWPSLEFAFVALALYGPARTLDNFAVKAHRLFLEYNKEDTRRPAVSSNAMRGVTLDDDYGFDSLDIDTVDVLTAVNPYEAVHGRHIKWEPYEIRPRPQGKARKRARAFRRKIRFADRLATLMRNESMATPFQEQCLRLYQSGENADAIAATAGCSASKVERALRHLGCGNPDLLPRGERAVRCARGRREAWIRRLLVYESVATPFQRECLQAYVAGKTVVQVAKLVCRKSTIITRALSSLECGRPYQPSERRKLKEGKPYPPACRSNFVHKYKEHLQYASPFQSRIVERLGREPVRQVAKTLGISVAAMYRALKALTEGRMYR